MSSSFLPVLLWAPSICHTFASTVPSRLFLLSLTSVLLNPGDTSLPVEALGLTPDVLSHPANSTPHSSWFSCIFTGCPCLRLLCWLCFSPPTVECLPSSTSLNSPGELCCFIAPNTTHGLVVPNLHPQLIHLSSLPDAWI